MTDDRWSRLDALLDEALDLPREERDAFVRERCPDPEDRGRLERLLAAAEDDVFGTGGAVRGDLGDELASHLERNAPPERIPGYRMIRRIGAGGMGQVWEAEQLEPVRRRVAVKVIRPECATPETLARFEIERQSLAIMNHPGIAQVYDAGVTASGRPFFAMEHVDGPPVTTFCDQERLTLARRLDLFLEICDAVQHAHQKGVIHRDLKPTNVLVVRSDDRSSPKVIDFGIARLAEGSAHGDTLLTTDGAVIGTPEYMSPEQAGGNPADVDTRSDVYSLGVLLFELLTGALPFRRSSSAPAALAELFREVREGETPRPSRFVTVTLEAGEVGAARRGTDRGGWIRALSGDLDWIVSKAMEKDPARRYDSVSELAEDLRRHRRHEPVQAGPPDTLYRVRKFVRRNRSLLVTSAVVFVALVAGLIGTATGLFKAREEAERARTQAAVARAVNDFLNEDLLAAVAPDAQGRDVGMQEVLDAAAERLEGRFREQPEVEANVRATIGRTYYALGRLDEASTHLERAVELQESMHGPDDPGTLDVVHVLGELRWSQGRIEECGELIRRVLDGRTRVLGPNHERTLAALGDLGTVSHYVGDLDEAERLYRDAYERARAVPDIDPEYPLTMQHNLGSLMRDLARYDEAETYLRGALEGTRELLGDEHPQTLATLSQLGSVLRESGRPMDAKPVYEQVLELRRRVLGDEHPGTLLSANNLALLRLDLGEPTAAEELFLVTLETQRRILGDDHDDTILTMGNLSAVYRRRERADDAERLSSEAVERCSRTMGATHALCCQMLRHHGESLTMLGRYEEAERELLVAHAGLADALGADHPDLGTMRRALRELYEEWGRPDEAAAWQDDAP